MSVDFLTRENCPLCGSASRVSVLEISYQEPALRQFIEAFYQGRVPLESFKSELYRVVQCPQCDLLYQDQILNDAGMQALYLDWVDQASSLRKKQNARARLFRQYASQIQSLSSMLTGNPAQTRILDYGMGWGYWSRMAQAHGYDVCGYELSPDRVTHARQLGIEVIDHLPDPGEHFDCIYANQVFEHLPQPLSTLQSLAACLRPGGVIYVRVPDGREVSARLAREGWSSQLDAIHPFEHINCFTRKSLIALGAGAQLKPVNLPLRLNWGSLWGGIKREFSDRFVTTHVLFRR